jgi:hypothetical protein
MSAPPRSRRSWHMDGFSESRMWVPWGQFPPKSHVAMIPARLTRWDEKAGLRRDAIDVRNLAAVSDWYREKLGLRETHDERE